MTINPCSHCGGDQYIVKGYRVCPNCNKRSDAVSGLFPDKYEDLALHFRPWKGGGGVDIMLRNSVDGLVDNVGLCTYILNQEGNIEGLTLDMPKAHEALCDDGDGNYIETKIARVDIMFSK